MCVYVCLCVRVILHRRLYVCVFPRADLNRTKGGIERDDLNYYTRVSTLRARFVCIGNQMSRCVKYARDR